MKIWQRILLFILLASSLSGCVAVGGAVVGVAGAAIIYDRRSIQASIDDKTISHNILQKLNANAEIKKQCHIGVSTYHKIVLLVGQAPTVPLRDKILEIVKTTPKIRKLYNQITIQGPTSLLTRASDDWITAKVKTQLLGAKGLRSGQFKVVTENGAVYLMGIVSRSQAQHAVNIVRNIKGVQKVVRVFEYSESR